MKCPTCLDQRFKINYKAGQYVSGNGEIVNVTLTCHSCETHVVMDYHEGELLHYFTDHNDPDNAKISD